MKIVFMGTPHFAVPALKKLIDSEHNIVGVFTKPPKPSGRGYKELISPIHELANTYNLPVYTPTTFKDQSNVEQLKNLKPDIIAVTAYGLILRKEVLEIPKFCCINIHPSKLPRWRGAAPLQHTILSGDKESAVCIMRMDEGMDTGDIIIQQDIDIPENMTAKELHDMTSQIGAELLLKSIDNLNKGTAIFTKQSEVGITYASKISRESEAINWFSSAKEIYDQIRTFSPKPGAFFRYNGENIKIITADYNQKKHSFKPGEVINENFSIACGEGILIPTLVQREGRKMIYTEAFLRGFPILKGTILTQSS